MRVGDIILNRSAGEDTPERYIVFLRWQGNEAVCVALANNVVRTVRYDKHAIRHDRKFKVVGNIPILKVLREGLQDAKRKTESAPTDSD